MATIDDITPEEFGAEYSRELNNTRELIFKSGDEVDVEYARSIFTIRFNRRAIEVIDSPAQIPYMVKGFPENLYSGDLCTSFRVRQQQPYYNLTNIDIGSFSRNVPYVFTRWNELFSIIDFSESWGQLLEDSIYFDVLKKANSGINFNTLGIDIENTLSESMGEDGLSTWNSMSLLGAFLSYSFHKAATNLGLNVTAKKTNRKSKTADYLQNVGALYTISTQDVIYIVRRPSSTFFEDNNLHNDQGPALQWRNGSKIFVLHNMIFEEELYWKTVKQELSLQEVNAIRNSDQRAIVWRMMNPHKLLESSKAVLLHTGVKGTNLYRIKALPTTGTVGYCMLMTCPSTQRQFLEWVNPAIGRRKDADLCQANAWGITKKQYLSMVAEG